MKNKLLLLIFGMFFLIGILSFTSATLKAYDSNSKTVTLSSNFLFINTGDIATITLNTPLDNHVGLGYQKVAEMQVIGFTDYKDLISQMDFYDVKKGMKKINRNYDLKVKGTEQVLVNDYSPVLVGYTQNGTAIYNGSEITGSHYETREIWNKLTPANLKKGDNLTIGIFTDVQINDKVEWIPTIANVKINEWATWTADLNVNLISYYKLDETSGTTAIDSVGSNNGTNNGATVNVSGKINTAYSFDGTNDYIDLGTTRIIDTSSDFTISSWVKWTSTGYVAGSIFARDGGGAGQNEFSLMRWPGGGNNENILFNVGNSNVVTNADLLGDGAWHHIVGVKSGSTLYIYVDGSLDKSGAFGSTVLYSVSTKIGARGSVSNYFGGTIDEIGVWSRALSSTEITQLYNGGSGISYTNYFGAIITLNSPVNAYNSTSQSIIFNGTVNAGSGDTLANVSLIIDGVYNETNTSGIDGEYLFSKTMSEGEHNWTLEGCEVTNGCTNASVRTFTVDTLSPIIEINSPTGTFNYLNESYNLTLNFTATDAHLDTCIWNYNSTNTTISCNNGTPTISYFNYEQDKNNGTLFINDTLGNVNSSSTSWNYKVLELNQTYSNSTTEGTSEDFLASFKLGSGYSVSSSYLNYNGTNSSGSTSTSGGITSFTATKLIPSVTADTNITFYPLVILSDSTTVNLQNHNQTIYNLAFDNCGSYTNRIFNLTQYDEETQTQLTNTTKSIAINFYSASNSSNLAINYSNEFTNNPTVICLNRNLTSVSNYTLDSIIRYKALGYASEYYNILGLSFNNNTPEQDINLYNLNASESTDFQLTFYGEDFLPVEGALVYLQRQYISENTFKTVELPRTDANGQTVLHLVRNDVIYNIYVTLNGTVIGTFNNIIAFCQDYSIGDCQLSLNALGGASPLFNYDNELGITFTSGPVYNETDTTVSFSFISTDSTIKNVTMDVGRSDVFGNTSICSNTLVSSSGTVSCNVGNLTDTSLITNIYVDGTLWIITTVPLDSTGYGSIGYVILFILTLVFILAFGDSKNGVIIATGIGYFVAAASGLVIGGIVGVGSSGIWIILLTAAALYQINKTRSK